MSNDDAIRATNDDATSCKRFAVQQGYWQDPYIQYFVRNPERKTPEINRGYYARVHGVKHLVNEFLQATKCKCQIINLGAGFDTTYWNLKDAGLSPTNFIELDFPGVTSRKCYYIKGRKQLLEKISKDGSDMTIDKYDLHGADYHIVGTDMRNLKEVEKKLDESKLDKELPTLLIAECVLVYMEGKHSAALLEWMASNISTLFFVNYEQVNMQDRFGQVMVENLRVRNCELQGIEHCASIESQKQRFLTTGWEGADCWEMTTVYANLPQADVQRIERLEFLDEAELLQQLFQHYCICWAYKDSAKIGLENISL